MKAEILQQQEVVELKHSPQPVPYAAAMVWMEARVQQVISGLARPSLWFLEHEAVYTAGVTANQDDLLDKEKLPVYHTSRGGKYTYHGPGQRVIYAIMNLQKLHHGEPDVRLFIRQLEQAVIETLAEFGIRAYLDPERIGIWVQHGGQERKIAAVGLHVKKWVTSHGIALNIHPEMEHFQGIVPCGLHNFTATSMKAMRVDVTMAQVDMVLREKLSKMLAVTYTASQQEDL